MSLSVASRRRYQTTTTTATPTATTTSSKLSVRKQHSLIEPASHAHVHAHCHTHGVGKYTAQQRGYLSRGLSVGRSIESIRQKLYDSSTGLTPLATEGRLVDASVHLRDTNLVAWSSTSSLLKTPVAVDSAHVCRMQAEQKEAQLKTDNAKADKNRINLNIVLAQTIRATNEQEPLHSDTECSELSKEQSVAAAVVATPPASAEDNVSSALTVQRRPPLVRAMSAPVRLDESSKCVFGTAASKRQQQKLRRRKIFTRAASSSVAVPPDDSSPLLTNDGNKKQLSRARSVIAPDVITLVSLLSSEGSDSEREENSTASASAATPTGSEKQSTSAAQRSPQRRAPLLRKTGKSVSFQDSYPPTFQLASKEYSHMIRRGSIAPLAARIRANRPPTAPPVSIFITEPGSKSGLQRQASSVEPEAASSSSEEAKKENNAANCNVQQQQQQQQQQQLQQQQQQQEQEQEQQQDYNFPLYVCSIKERECWKLHQKMSAKGVSVSYETVLRGMLTPTEFRLYQKQRELEETKAQEAAEAEAEAAAATEKESSKKLPATAIERLSESLLQSK